MRQRLEDAFGHLEPPFVCELGWREPTFEEALKTDSGRAKRWQELRPLFPTLLDGSDINGLTPEATQYYLPAYLYAMTDPDFLWPYLDSILYQLWYEEEDGTPLFNQQHYREKWERLTALLTDQQKSCIAHSLVEIWKATDDVPDVTMLERHRIANMLNRYWNAWL